MSYYEILFETGAMSVMNAEDDAEVLGFVEEQDRRARNGLPGGPIGQPAERIAKVYKYDEHPDDYNTEMTASKDVLKKEVAALVDKLADDNGVVAIDALADGVRAISHPMKPERENVFDSMYKMESTGEVDLSSLEGGA
jgi:hypothetical protein